MANQRTPRLVLRQVVAPTAEPVLLADVKAHSRVTIGDDDSLLTARIIAARQHVEDRMRRQLITAGWRLSLEDFPRSFDFVGAFIRPTREGRDILLPRPQIQSVASITYIDTNGNQQTVSPSIYDVSTDDEPGRVALKYGQVWPDVQPDTINSVQVTYVSGYGATSASVPEAIKVAIYLLIGFWYENREGGGTVPLLTREQDFTISALLSPYVVREVY